MRRAVLASPSQTCHPDWGASRLCGDARGASAAFNSRGQNPPEDLMAKSSDLGMFVCLNSCKQAAIFVFHTLCVLWCIFNGTLLSELDFSFVSLFRVFISSWISVRYIFNIFLKKKKAASAEKKDVLWQTKFYKQKKYQRFFFFNTWKPKWAAFYKSSCCVFSKNKCHLRTEVCFFKEMWLIAAVWRKLCKYRNEYIVSLSVLLKRSSSVQIKMLLWVS